MPLSCDPDATADFALRCDVDKPAETRPTFVCRFLSRRQSRRQRELYNAAKDAPTDDEAEARLLDSILIGVTGWRNMTTPDGPPAPAFSRDALLDLLTNGELWELAYSYPLALRLTESERGKSESPSPTGSGSAAPTAAAASVEVDPPPTPQPSDPATAAGA